MSRIGKRPVVLPEKVEVKLQEGNVLVKGKKGELNYSFPKDVKIELKDREIFVSPASNSLQSRAMWGTARTLIDNMVTGVTSGFSKSLIFQGVGYKAVVKGQTLTLNLGYSHPINYPLPEGD